MEHRQKDSRVVRYLIEFFRNEFFGILKVIRVHVDVVNVHIQISSLWYDSSVQIDVLVQVSSVDWHWRIHSKSFLDAQLNKLHILQLIECWIDAQIVSNDSRDFFINFLLSFWISRK